MALADIARLQNVRFAPSAGFFPHSEIAPKPETGSYALVLGSNRPMIGSVPWGRDGVERRVEAVLAALRT